MWHSTALHCNRQQACPVFSRLQPASHYYYYCQRQAVLCVALVALPPPPPPPPAHRWTGRRRKKLEFGGKMLQMCAQAAAAAAAAKVVCDLWTRHVASCLPLLLLLRARSAEREDLTYISNEKRRERGEQQVLSLHCDACQQKTREREREIP